MAKIAMLLGWMKNRLMSRNTAKLITSNKTREKLNIQTNQERKLCDQRLADFVKYIHTYTHTHTHTALAHRYNR